MSRPPTVEEIEETNHQDWFEKYMHDQQFYYEYHVPQWVMERAERNYWGEIEGGESLFHRNSVRTRSNKGQKIKDSGTNEEQGIDEAL